MTGTATSPTASPAPDQLDRVAVIGIEAAGRHGVFDHEKTDGQRFVADVVMFLDSRRAAASDDLADAVDYGAVATRVHDILAGQGRDLVETVVDEIALAVLADPRVAAVDVTLHKPQAPVTVPFADVTIEVRRTRADLAVATPPAEPVPVVLALGSNLGDRAGMLAGAVLALAAVPGLMLDAVSPVVETDPVGGPDQPDYLNAVVLARGTLSALALLHACQDVEEWHGRQRSAPWGPRTLDIDVLSVGDLVADTATLDLPHPRAHQRGFVLVPWLSVSPDAVLHDASGSRRVADLVTPLRAADGQVPGVRERDDIRLVAPAVTAPTEPTARADGP